MHPQKESTVIDCQPIAHEVVAECRKEGVTSVDDVTIRLDFEMRSIGVRIDRIKRLVAGRI